MNTALKTKIKTHVLHRVKPYLSDLYKYQDQPHDEEIETYFKTSDGREIPVFKNHRYTLKPAWKMFGPIVALDELAKRNILDGKDTQYLQDVKGYRTPKFPLSKTREILEPYLKKHAPLFLSTDIPDLGARILTPTKIEVEQTIAEKAREHKKLLDKISGIVPYSWDENAAVLEVGYTSGGESIIGFERLGLQAYGLDYNYDGTFETNSRHAHVKEIAQSKATFLNGDVTKKTPIEENSLDLIHTQSVLEHIQNLPDAFAEMYRMLKPGGVMFHRYDPYFYIKGGHPPCMLDSPWAHMRMNDQDIERYIEELRPNEAHSTIPWIRSALNRKHTQAFVQQTLAEKGFQIYWWQALEVPEEQKNLLTPEIISDCLKVNPGVTLSDLLCYSVAFIAVKPK